MMLGFLAFAYVARTLSAESYGLLEYAIGLTGVAAIVVEGGFGPIGALIVSRRMAEAPRVAGQIFVARCVLLLPVVVAVGLIGHLSGQSTQVRPLVWLFAVSLGAIPFKHDWLLQGLEKMTYVAQAQALRAAVFAGIVVWVVHRQGDLLRVGGAEIAAAFIASAYYLFLQTRVGVPVRWRTRKSDIWALIKAGASVSASNIVWPIMLYLPVFLVTHLAGAAEAARLGGAQRIVVSFVSYSALYFFSLYPVMSRRIHQGGDDWNQLMRSSYRLIAWASIGGALVMAVTGESILVFAFGAAFAAAAPVFSIYVWLLPVRLLSGHARWTLVAGERQGFLLVAELLGMVTVLVLGIAMSLQFGAAGAAAAVVIGNVVVWIAAHIFAERQLAALPGVWQTVMPVGAAVASAVLARIFDGGVASTLAIAAVTYAVFMRIVGGDLVGDVRRLAYAKGDAANICRGSGQTAVQHISQAL
jgi:O-antigen/teichoic acid export membrane protein